MFDIVKRYQYNVLLVCKNTVTTYLFPFSFHLYTFALQQRRRESSPSNHLLYKVGRASDVLVNFEIEQIYRPLSVIIAFSFL